MQPLRHLAACATAEPYSWYSIQIFGRHAFYIASLRPACNVLSTELHPDFVKEMSQCQRNLFSVFQLISKMSADQRMKLKGEIILETVLREKALSAPLKSIIASDSGECDGNNSVVNDSLVSPQFQLTVHEFQSLCELDVRSCKGKGEGRVVVLPGFQELQVPALSNPKGMVLSSAVYGDLADFCFLSLFSRGVVFVFQIFLCL